MGVQTPKISLKRTHKSNESLLKGNGKAAHPFRLIAPKSFLALNRALERLRAWEPKNLERK